MKVKLNRQGMREMLTSTEMQAITREYAEQVKRKAGNEYTIGPTFKGREKAMTSVWADSPKAISDNAINNTLLKAVK